MFTAKSPDVDNIDRKCVHSLKTFFFKSIFLCTPKLDVENQTVSIIEYIITIIVINFIRINVLESTSLFLDSKIMWFVTSTFSVSDSVTAKKENVCGREKAPYWNRWRRGGVDKMWGHAMLQPKTIFTQIPHPDHHVFLKFWFVLILLFKLLYFYTPHNKVVGGYTAFTMSVRPSVCRQILCYCPFFINLFFNFNTFRLIFQKL